MLEARIRIKEPNPGRRGKCTDLECERVFNIPDEQ